MIGGLTQQVWLRGQVSALTITPRVTVVGSRAASARGLHRAQALGRALAERGALVISGGAVGVDGAAHEGALQAGGSTCAVLGTGVDKVYPARHADLFEAITRRGCLLSMFELGEPPRRAHFPQRNQLMAALAEVVIVIEASPRSGTQSTARAARDYGRKVLCFPDSPGTQLLAQTGATAVNSVVEVLPCMREPTIAPLHHNAGFAVKAAVPRADLPSLIRRIKEHGGTDIVVFGIAQIVP